MSKKKQKKNAKRTAKGNDRMQRKTQSLTKGMNKKQKKPDAIADNVLPVINIRRSAIHSSKFRTFKLEKVVTEMVSESPEEEKEAAKKVDRL